MDGREGDREEEEEKTESVVKEEVDRSSVSVRSPERLETGGMKSPHFSLLAHEIGSLMSPTLPAGGSVGYYGEMPGLWSQADMGLNSGSIEPWASHLASVDFCFLI